MSVSLISNIFNIQKNFLYHELSLYVLFPSKKLVGKYLSKSFEKKPSIEIIVDETEIFVDRATSMKT